MNQSFTQLRNLIVWNIRRAFGSNGIDISYFDPQELDETLTHGENLRIVLGARGLRTREDWRIEIRRYSPKWRNRYYH